MLVVVARVAVAVLKEYLGWARGRRQEAGAVCLPWAPEAQGQFWGGRMGETRGRGREMEDASLGQLAPQAAQRLAAAGLCGSYRWAKARPAAPPLGLAPKVRRA